MTSVSMRVAGVAAAAVAVIGVASCSSSSSNSGAGGNSAKPVYGGTLNVVAASGPDHLDPVPAYTTYDYQFEQAYTRQLLTYPTVAATSISSAAWTQTTTPVADVATEVPTTANGGITNGGKTYTFHIKPGVDWDSTPARQVTADDFIREFKAFCNPAPGGFVGNVTYYEATIAGFTSYCNAETAYFTNTKAHPVTAANVAAFQNSHTISGLSAPNSLTVQFTLTSPASDFLYMLAMPFASARPVEYDSYLPNSLQLDQNTLSDGPYKIVSYVPGKSLTMVRNSAWKQSTDSTRHDYVAKVVLTMGVTSAQTQLSEMQAGTEDIFNDTPLNPSSVSTLETSGDSNFRIWPWSNTYPYIVFNLRSPNNTGAMGKLLVRQAFEYGLDKSAVVKADGGPAVASVINTVIPPGNVGYQDYNLYPDNNGQGNTAMCKQDLSRAGYPHGLSVSFMYLNDSTNTRWFEAAQASLAQCGITLNGKPEPASSFYTDLGNSPVNNKAGTWDAGFGAWIPDWFGNNGRTIISALFQGPDCVVNTVNYGCYDNPAVNSLISQAEAAPSVSAAGADWHQADVDIMKDAVIVPIMSINYPVYSSARVRSVGYSTAIFEPNIGDPSITDIWLANG
jgi:peptide/nickel transport system substrate-binding protein